MFVAVSFVSCQKTNSYKDKLFVDCENLEPQSLEVKSYNTPPQLYIGFQPSGLPQYETAKEALRHGTLWPLLFSPYPNPQKRSDS